jgi:hypothetical protein
MGVCPDQTVRRLPVRQSAVSHSPHVAGPVSHAVQP